MILKSLIVITILILSIIIFVWLGVKFYYFLGRESDLNRKQIKRDEETLQEHIEQLEKLLKKEEKYEN